MSPLITLRVFQISPGYNFPNLHTPNIIIYKPLCYNLHSLELFAYPLRLKYPRLRNPGLKQFLSSFRTLHFNYSKLEHKHKCFRISGVGIQKRHQYNLPLKSSWSSFLALALETLTLLSREFFCLESSPALTEKETKNDFKNLQCRLQFKRAKQNIF